MSISFGAGVGQTTNSPARESGQTDRDRQPRQTAASSSGDVLTITPTADGHGVAVRGDVDLCTVPALESALEGLVSGSGDVHLELGELRFVDLSGAGALVAAAARLGPDRVLVLHQPPPTLQRILDHFWNGAAPIRMDC